MWSMKHFWKHVSCRNVSSDPPTLHAVMPHSNTFMQSYAGGKREQLLVMVVWMDTRRAGVRVLNMYGSDMFVLGKYCGKLCGRASKWM